MEVFERLGEEAHVRGIAAAFVYKSVDPFFPLESLSVLEFHHLPSSTRIPPSLTVNYTAVVAVLLLLLLDDSPPPPPPCANPILSIHQRKSPHSAK